jgi:Major Facilitator Superfamily
MANARRLDALNFFLADVRDGLGPYLAIYLLTIQHWDQASIGLVMSVGGIAGILAQTPAGAIADGTTAKRAVLVSAAAIVTLGSLALPWMSNFASVAVMNAAAGAAGAIFAPTSGRYHAWHGRAGCISSARWPQRSLQAGNATAAALAAATALWFGPVVVFWIMALVAVVSVVIVLSIPAAAIDHRVARGLEAGAEHTRARPSGLSVLLSSRPLLIFAACAMLFHFANAAMLPLVGQKLALINKEVGGSVHRRRASSDGAGGDVSGSASKQVGNRSSLEALRSWRCAGSSTPCGTIHTGWSEFSCSMASEPAFSALCSSDRERHHLWQRTLQSQSGCDRRRTRYWRVTIGGGCGHNRRQSRLRRCLLGTRDNRRGGLCALSLCYARNRRPVTSTAVSEKMRRVREGQDQTSKRSADALGSAGPPLLHHNTRGGEPLDCGVVETVLAQHLVRVL